MVRTISNGEAKKTKTRQVVDRSLRHGPIRTGLANVREFVQGMPDNPLRKPALDCCGRLAVATSIIEHTSMRFDANAATLVQLRSEFERSANEVSATKRFYQSSDANGWRQDYIKQREKEARDKIAKEVSEKFSAQAADAAAKAVKALQDYDHELVKQRVVYNGIRPTHPNLPSLSVSEIGFRRMKLEASGWPWIRKLGYLQDLNQLFSDGDPQLEIGELVIMELIAEYEANPPTFKPGDRTGKLEDERRCVEKIKALIENRSAKEPEFLVLHQHVAWPCVVTLFKTVLGHDVRTMPAAQLAKLYKGEGRKPWDLMPDWQARYCLPDARALLGRHLDLNLKYRPPGVPTLSEALEEQRKKQPKKAAG